MRAKSIYTQDEDELTDRQLLARMEHALQVMEKMTPHERRRHFDMSDWVQVTECGTVACLAGHCALDPWFRKHGFSINVSEDMITPFSVDPMDYFGEVIHRTIFLDVFASYGIIKKKVKSVIKDLKKHLGVK